ncbi:TBC1 domain family member 15 isoform X2 [Pleurodeles waltl]|uniref:TBC1 domain family member 15 isoform X2 n=1 Tax=Pleurodeles waltl TaxID=8319 RepID=UPI003709B5C4
MATPTTGKTVFEQNDVFVQSCCVRIENQDGLIPGTLRIFEKEADVVVDWKPLEDNFDSTNIPCPGKDSSSVVEWSLTPKERTSQGIEHQLSYEAEWDMVNTVSYKKKYCSNGDSSCPFSNHTKTSFQFCLADLSLIKHDKEDIVWTCLVFYLKNDVPLPAVQCHHDVGMRFIECLAKYVVLQESDVDARILLVTLTNKSSSQSFENLLDEQAFGLIQIDVGQRLNVHRREPLSPTEWKNSMDPEGRILNADHMKEIIFKGGVCHALRKEVWKFLLNYFPWNSTKQERINIQKTKTDEYFRMKLQWKSVSVEQEDRNTRFKDFKSLIEKDVNRTDRTNTFYEGLDNPSLILLHDILMTYCMYDFDLGYVQGMSDLLSPVLYVMENEVDAFWCFVSYMDQMHQNFEEQMQGLKMQLIQLSTLLRLLDSAFCSYLESQDSGYLYFCFRWLLIRFKREFSFNDILRIWEVMWTGLPCENFHLLICCAILESEKPNIMDQNYGFNEILKHINELSMKLDVDDVLCKAEAICLQMMKCKDLPPEVHDILGMKNCNSLTANLEPSEKESFDARSSQISAHQAASVPLISTKETRSDTTAFTTRLTN